MVNHLVEVSLVDAPGLQAQGYTQRVGQVLDLVAELVDQLFVGVAGQTDRAGDRCVVIGGPEGFVLRPRAKLLWQGGVKLDDVWHRDGDGDPVGQAKLCLLYTSYRRYQNRALLDDR